MSGLVPPSDEHSSSFTWSFARELDATIYWTQCGYIGLPVMAHCPTRMSQLEIPRYKTNPVINRLYESGHHGKAPWFGFPVNNNQVQEFMIRWRACNSPLRILSPAIPLCALIGGWFAAHRTSLSNVPDCIPLLAIL